MRIKDSIDNAQAYWWVFITVCTIISFIGGAVWIAAGKNQLLDSTQEQIAEVKAVAATAALTAATAASEVKEVKQGVAHVTQNVARADAKLDTIIEQQGRTSGQIGLLIQMQVAKNPMQAGLKERKEPDWPKVPAPDTILVQKQEPRVITR